MARQEKYTVKFFATFQLFNVLLKKRPYSEDVSLHARHAFPALHCAKLSYGCAVDMLWQKIPIEGPNFTILFS